MPGLTFKQRFSSLSQALVSAVLTLSLYVPSAQADGTTMTREQPFTVRAEGFDYDHWVQVTLPISYHMMPDKDYPVLWLTDGPFFMGFTPSMAEILFVAGRAPEVIIVAVGTPPSLGPAVNLDRRMIDFAPPADKYNPDTLAGRIFNNTDNRDDKPKKADQFLAFLVDQLRPRLAREFRMSGDHTLLGSSGGGLFAAYTLFSQPNAFSKYIIGSPFLNGSDLAVFKLEEAYAEKHDDLDATVFFGAGQQEVGQMAYTSIVSSMYLMAETLHLRNYPSLKVTTRQFPGEDHITVLPDLVRHGMQVVYEEEARTLPNLMDQR